MVERFWVGWRRFERKVRKRANRSEVRRYSSGLSAEAGRRRAIRRIFGYGCARSSSLVNYGRNESIRVCTYLGLAVCVRKSMIESTVDDSGRSFCRWDPIILMDRFG